MIALVKTENGISTTIWFGPQRHLPEHLFEEADESHVNEEDYDRIAAKAEATGKGMKLQ